ncbi:MAG: hypothetical protein RL071_3948 [Pseudomonadota bacterium]
MARPLLLSRRAAQRPLPPRRPLLHRGLALGLLALLGACVGDPDEKADDGSEDSAPVDSGSGDDLPPAVCNPGQRWTAGTTAFVDASAAWGLPELMPVGVRMLAVDFDNDGWTDLLVRSGTTPTTSPPAPAAPGCCATPATAASRTAPRPRASCSPGAPAPTAPPR